MCAALMNSFSPIKICEFQTILHAYIYHITFEELISMNTKLNGVILVVTAKKNMYYVTIKSVLSKLLGFFF